MGLPARGVLAALLALALSIAAGYAAVRLGAGDSTQTAVISAVFVFTLWAGITSWSQTGVVTALVVAAVVGVLVYSPEARTTVAHWATAGQAWLQNLTDRK